MPSSIIGHRKESTLHNMIRMAMEKLIFSFHCTVAILPKRVERIVPTRWQMTSNAFGLTVSDIRQRIRGNRPISRVDPT